MNLSFFDICYYDLFMQRDSKTLKKEVDFIEKLVPCGQRKIIDFCCGVGDLLGEFERRGWEVAGVEWVPEYVDLARNQFGVGGVKCGNALLMDFDIQADVCLNWFSSFGYFSRSTGFELLKNMKKHLKPGGILIVETYNAFDVLLAFKGKMTYEKERDGQKIKISRNSEIEMAGRNLRQVWEIDGFEKEMTTHLYFQDEIVEMLKTLGFKDVSVYDSSDRARSFVPPTIHSKRLVFIAKGMG